MPSYQSSSRLATRLGQLPHDVLAELAAWLSSDSAALQATAEECMAAHSPLPLWAVERVLLSPDLMPHLLRPLEAEDGAAAAVCSQWLTGWKVTNAPRRRLKQVPFDLPEEIGTCSGLTMVGTPDGQLVVRAGTQLHILDRSMRVLQTVAGEYRGSIAAGNDSIFNSNSDGEALHRSSHDGTVDAEYQLEDCHFCCPVLAPGGLLFCAIYTEDDTVGDEIIALDAQTLQLRHRFGRGLLNVAHPSAVGGDELYVCDTNNHRLQVFSLTGEHRRSIMGEWRSPIMLCFAKDRLYLVEREYNHNDDVEEDEDGITHDPVQGSRILVLSLEGDILQVVTHPILPTALFTAICCFEHKLLASYFEYTKIPGPTRSGIIALQGL